MAWHSLQLPRDSRIHFSFPGLKDLVITHGANQIRWKYLLNTITTPTYGGEVQQILSGYVDELVVSGNTPNDRQLQQIYHWFRNYMALATHKAKDRHQTGHVTMTYPARNWSFYLHVLEAPGFEMATDKIANEWSIVAHPITDQDEIHPTLVSAATNPLHLESLNKTISNVDFDMFGPAINPQASANVGGLDTDIGENFQRLVAAFSGGDVGYLWGYSALTSPDLNVPTTATDYWRKIFGSEYLINDNPGADGSQTSGATTGSYTYKGPPNPTDKANVARLIYSTFESKGIPGRLGIAVALQETTNLSPNTRQPDGDYAVGLFQTFPGGEGSNWPNASHLADAHSQRGKPVTANYTTSMQVSDAAGWFKKAANGRGLDDVSNFSKMAQWAQDAQKAGHSYTDPSEGLPRFRQNWAEAADLIRQHIPLGGTTQVADTNLGKIAKPMATGTLTSPYGPRGGRNHDGVDIGAVQGTQLYAAQAGTVRHRWYDGYGRTIVLECDKADFLYAHLSGYDTANGAKVEIGANIGKSGGRVGSSGAGSSRGEHLHFEIHPGGHTFGSSAVDPWPYVKRFYE